MDFGLSILIAVLSGSVSYLLKDIVMNAISGLWLKLSGEIEEGGRIRIKTDFGTVDGKVLKIRLRNTEIEKSDGEGILLRESEDIFKKDVLKMD